MAKLRNARWLIAGGLSLLVGSLFAFQRQFREYPGIEYDDFPPVSQRPSHEVGERQGRITDASTTRRQCVLPLPVAHADFDL